MAANEAHYSAKLSSFPVEVLANITSNLGCSDVLNTLFSSGDRILLAKLNHGGITELHYYLPRLSTRSIKLIQSLKLSSFSIHAHSEQIRRVSELILGMQPCLRHLTVLHPAVSYLLANPNSIFYDRRLPLIGSLEAPWIVSSTFPQLLSFNATGFGGEGSPSVASIALFYKGLPHSLTALSLPPDRLSVDIWKLIPPGLTFFATPNGALPSQSHLPALDSITSLSCSLISYHTYDQTEPRHRPSGFSAPTTLSGWEPHLSQLALPRNLVQLTASLPRRCIEPGVMLPPSIRTLKWTFAYDDQMLLYDLLHFLPPKVSKVHLTGLNITVGEGSQFSEMPRLSEITDIEMARCSMISGDLDSLWIAFTELLKSISNATRVSLDIDSLAGITPTNLANCKFPNLRILDATFHASCFVLDEHGYPLHRYLSHLRELVIQCVLEENLNPFTFAAIPPSLDCLKTGKWTVGTETLHLLSVNTRFTAEFLLLQPASNLDSLIFHPSSAPSHPSSTSSTSNPTNALDLEPVKGTSFCPTTRIAIKPAEFLASDGSVAKRHMIVFSPNTDDGSTLRWSRSISLPRSLTALKVPKFMLGIVDLYCITPSNLPNLIELDLSDHAFPRDSSYNFGGFSELESLSIASLKVTSQSTCPPKLTRLVTKEMLEFPPSFLPLPQTLTHVECSIINPVTALKPLNLRIAAFSDIIDLTQLPSSITELKVFTLPNAIAEETVRLASLFPALKKLHLRNSIPIELLDRMEDVFAPDVSFEFTCLNYDDNGHELLAARLKCHPGSIVLDHEDALLHWINIGIRRAYRCQLYDRNVVEFNPLSFSRFSKYLSPESTHLSFTMKTKSSHNWVKDLPSGLEFLKVFGLKDSNFPASFVEDLPVTLQSLVFHGFSLSSSIISRLPRGLTYLEAHLATWTDSVWPPSITKLCSENVQASSFDKLPSTLEVLIIRSAAASASELKMLPAGLKILQCIRNPPNFDTLLQVAETKGFSLLSAPDAFNEIQRSKYLNALLVE